MNGQYALNGFQVQTIVALLRALEDDESWIRMTLEPLSDEDRAMEKVDILWEDHDGLRTVVQVKSSKNKIRIREAREWADQLVSSNPGDNVSYQLVLVCSRELDDELREGGRIDAHGREVVVPPPAPNDIGVLYNGASIALERQLELRQLPHLGPKSREDLIDCLHGKLLRGSISGRAWARDEFDTLVARLVHDKAEPAEGPRIVIIGSRSGVDSHLNKAVSTCVGRFSPRRTYLHQESGHDLEIADGLICILAWSYRKGLWEAIETALEREIPTMIFLMSEVHQGLCRTDVDVDGDGERLEELKEMLRREDLIDGEFDNKEQFEEQLITALWRKFPPGGRCHA